MAIQVQGTTVIDDSRNAYLNSISSTLIDTSNSRSTYVNLGTVDTINSTIAIDMTAAESYILTVAALNTTLNLTGTSIASGKMKTVLLRITFNSGSVVWPYQTVWPNDAPPPTAANGKSLLVAFTLEGTPSSTSVIRGSYTQPYNV